MANCGKIYCTKICYTVPIQNFPAAAIGSALKPAQEKITTYPFQ